jgi:hypothetical protein
VTGTPSPRSFGGRAGILGCILVVPFLQFVLRSGYSPFRLEVLAGAGVLALGCLPIAWACRGPAFYGASCILIVLLSTNAVQGLVFQGLDVRMRWTALGIAVAVLLLMYWMRQVFFRLVAIFALGSFAVSAVQFLAARSHPAEALAQESRPRGLGHVIYLILDEHIGLAGLPDEIPECRRARKKLEDVLRTNGFEIYPNAFSNYIETLDSIPSILNFELEPERRSFARRSSPAGHTATRNALFARLRSQGYAIAAYESDYLEYCAAGAECSATTRYAANTIGPLDRLPIPWPRKAEHLVSTYLLSDMFVWGITYKALPHWFEPPNWRMGPLSLADIWPERMSRDILRARRKTLFFAHLLTPHSPYVYRPDGTLRDDREWTDGRSWPATDRAACDREYAHYGEQVEYLSGQLDGFLRRLRADPVYDSSLIVIHGDHGARLLWRSAEAADGAWVAGDDLAAGRAAGSPPVRALIDGYSTLLAVKPPGAVGARIEPRCTSVLRVISETFDPRGSATGPPADSEAYVFDAQGRPRPIPMAEACREMEGRLK